jgi:mono/diheme cytochrome c family protein
MTNGHSLRLLTAFLLALALPPSAHADDDERESAFRGKRLAEANCAGCHAIAQFDDSPLRLAPPFRNMAERFSPSALRALLGGPVFLEHAVMPDFEPSAEQAEDLATYILSIAERVKEADEGPARHSPQT